MQIEDHSNLSNLKLGELYEYDSPANDDICDREGKPTVYWNEDTATVLNRRTSCGSSDRNEIPF